MAENTCLKDMQAEIKRMAEFMDYAEGRFEQLDQLQSMINSLAQSVDHIHQRLDQTTLSPTPSTTSPILVAQPVSSYTLAKAIDLQYGPSQTMPFSSQQPQQTSLFQQPISTGFGLQPSVAAPQPALVQNAQLIPQMAKVAPIPFSLADRDIQAIVDAYKEEPGNSTYAFKQLFSVAQTECTFINRIAIVPMPPYISRINEIQMRLVFDPGVLGGTASGKTTACDMIIRQLRQYNFDSPAGVGFSYTNKSSDLFTMGGQSPAEDAYPFLVNGSYCTFLLIEPFDHIVNVRSATAQSIANVTEIHYGLNLSSDEDEDEFGIFSVKFSTDGQEFIATTSDCSICAYDLRADELSLRIPGHKSDVNTVCKVWDRRCFVSKGKSAGTLVGQLQGIIFSDSHGDGRYLISNGKDQTTKLWDIRKMSSGVIHPGIQDEDWDYKWITYPQYARNLNHPKDQSLSTYKGHSMLRTLICCYFFPSYSTGQKCIYTGSSDGSVYIDDLVSGTQVAKLDHHEGPASDCSWHPVYPRLVSSSWDSDSVRWEFPGHGEPTARVRNLVIRLKHDNHYDFAFVEGLLVTELNELNCVDMGFTLLLEETSRDGGVWDLKLITLENVDNLSTLTIYHITLHHISLLPSGYALRLDFFLGHLFFVPAKYFQGLSYDQRNDSLVFVWLKGYTIPTYIMETLSHQHIRGITTKESGCSTVDCGAVPALLRHLQLPEPIGEGDGVPKLYEHELEKGCVFILGLLAVKPEHQQLVVDAGALPSLMDLSKRHKAGDNSRALTGLIRRAADAITNLAHENSSTKTCVRMAGGIPHLVELLEFDDAKLQMAATAGAIRTLAFKNDENKNRIVGCNALPTLVLMLGSDDAAIHSKAVGVIGNLVHSSPNIKRKVLLVDAILVPCQDHFSNVDLEDKVHFNGGGIVMDPTRMEGPDIIEAHDQAAQLRKSHRTKKKRDWR